MRLFILANPSSGNGHAEKVIDKIRENYPDLTILPFLTRYKGDDGNQVKAVLKVYEPNKDRLLILGGDGTLSQILATLPADIPFAYYPTGSGNDFARSLGIKKLDKVMTSLLANKTTPISVLSYDKGVIINSLDFGFTAKVISYTEQSRLKSWLKALGLGRLTYIIYALKTLFISCSVTIDVQYLDEHLQLDDLFFVSFANNTYFGGGIMIWPDATAFEKQIDMVYIKNKGFLKNILGLLALLGKRHQKSPYLTHVVADAFKLTLSKGHLAQVDGEFMELTETDLICQQRYIYR